MCEVVRIGSMITYHICRKSMNRQVLHTVGCDISGQAAGQIRAVGALRNIVRSIGDWWLIDWLLYVRLIAIQWNRPYGHPVNLVPVVYFGHCRLFCCFPFRSKCAAREGDEALCKNFYYSISYCYYPVRLLRQISQRWTFTCTSSTSHPRPKRHSSRVTCHARCHVT